MSIQIGVEESYGVLKGYMGKPNIDYALHVHNSIELIYVIRGYMTELFPMQSYRIEPGQLAAFYALVPHRCMDTTEGSFVYGMHLPMAKFLQWDLPKDFVSRLFRGELLIEDNPDRKLLDETQFDLWMKDVAALDANQIESLYAEVHGRLRRMAAGMAAKSAASRGGKPLPVKSFQLFHWGDNIPVPEDQATPWDKLEKMTMFISTNYRESVTVADVAKHAGVHPNYASSLFHSAYGMTITEYITERRLNYAYRALTETSSTILAIALEAGFGSVRRFHHVFLTKYGQTPSSARKPTED
ncbi:MAG: helix-turn-helix protein [Capsulimonas sp.]|nr:helix-turn-helix protein [Capsulimonas sp.]